MRWRSRRFNNSFVRCNVTLASGHVEGCLMPCATARRAPYGIRAQTFAHRASSDPVADTGPARPAQAVSSARRNTLTRISPFNEYRWRPNARSRVAERLTERRDVESVPSRQAHNLTPAAPSVPTDVRPPAGVRRAEWPATRRIRPHPQLTGRGSTGHAGCTRLARR